MKKMSLLLVVILLLNILSFNVFAGDIEHLKWFYSIDDVVYEPKGSGVIKINDSIMVSINEFCGLLGYVISEGNGKVTMDDETVFADYLLEKGILTEKEIEQIK